MNVGVCVWMFGLKGRKTKKKKPTPAVIFIFQNICNTNIESDEQYAVIKHAFGAYDYKLFVHQGLAGCHVHVGPKQ